MPDITAIPYKITTTIAIFGGFIVMGVGTGIIGPTILTLADNINQDISSLSFLVFSKGFGYMLGSFLIQFVSSKFSQYFLLAFASALSAFGEAACPLARSAMLIMLSKFISGFGMGIVENVGTVTLVQIWKDKSDPMLQIGQLTYGFGSVISPFLAKPFINPIIHEFTNNGSIQAYNFTTQIATTFSIYVPPKSFPYVAWPYFIIAGISLIFMNLFIFLGCASPSLYAPKKPEKSQRDYPTFRFTFLFTVLIFYILHVSEESCIGNYLFSFMVLSELKAGNNSSTLLNGIWWSFYMLGSVIAVFASTKLRPQLILNVDMVGLAVSMVMLLCFPIYVQSAPFVLWVGIALHALFLANVYPTGVTLTAHNTLLNSGATAVFSIGSGLGEMLVPSLLGSLINDNPNMFLWILGSNLLLVIVFYLLLVFISNKKTWFERRKRRNEEKTIVEENEIML